MLPFEVRDLVACDAADVAISDIEAIPSDSPVCLYKYILDRAEPPIKLSVSSTGPSSSRFQELRRYTFGQWHDKPVISPPMSVFYSPHVTALGFGITVEGTDGWAPFTFPRNSRPDRGLDVEFDEPRKGARLSRPIRVSETLDGPILSLGAVPNHFGHFLLELLARLWLVDWARSRRIRLVALHSGRLSKWQADLFRFAGIAPGEITWIDRPTVLTRAYVPSPLYRLHQSYHPSFRETLQAMANNAGGPGEHEKLFLGRSKLAARHRLLNEDAIADVYREFGYHVMYPEIHSIEEQIRAGAGAQHIAGPIGSQTYAALFQKKAHSAHIFASPNFVFSDDALIASMNGGSCHMFFPDEVVHDELPRFDAFQISPDAVRAKLKKQFG